MQFLLFTLFMIYVALALLTPPHSRFWSFACLALLLTFVPLHYANILAHARVTGFYPLFIVESFNGRSVLELDLAQVTVIVELVRQREQLTTLMKRLAKHGKPLPR